MRSGREVLPSRAGFRQWPWPNHASVTRSEAGGCADEGGSDGEPSSLTSVAQRQRGSKDGQAAGPCLRRVLAAGRQETLRCPSHSLPRPLGFPWLPGLGSSTSQSRADVGGKGCPVLVLAAMLCHLWNPEVPVPSPSAPRSLGRLDHPRLSAGAMGKGCQGRAGTCPTCPGAIAAPGQRSPDPPTALFPHGQTVLSPRLQPAWSWPVPPAPSSPNACPRLSQSCSNCGLNLELGSRTGLMVLGFHLLPLGSSSSPRSLIPRSLCHSVRLAATAPVAPLLCLNQGRSRSTPRLPKPSYPSCRQKNGAGAQRAAFGQSPATARRHRCPQGGPESSADAAAGTG